MQNVKKQVVTDYMYESGFYLTQYSQETCVVSDAKTDCCMGED